jgi:thiosulfate reductase cytochrome b subunit
LSDAGPEPVTDAPDGPNIGAGAAAAPAATGLGGAVMDEIKKPENRRRLHPVPVRIMHWLNAVAMIVMITSGWGIYNDYVILNGVHFARWMRLGSWAAESLLWHFAGMWLLALNGLAYLIYGLVTGRLRERLLPIRFHALVKTVIETLHFKIAHDDIRHYNAVQKLLYIIVILASQSGNRSSFPAWWRFWEGSRARGCCTSWAWR